MKQKEEGKGNVAKAWYLPETGNNIVMKRLHMQRVVQLSVQSLQGRAGKWRCCR